MAENDYSGLLNGGDIVGMTNEQYKGMLVDQVRPWKRVLELAIEAGNTEIQKVAEEQIEDYNTKLKI